MITFPCPLHSFLVSYCTIYLCIVHFAFIKPLETKPSSLPYPKKNLKEPLWMLVLCLIYWSSTVGFVFLLYDLWYSEVRSPSLINKKNVMTASFYQRQDHLLNTTKTVGVSWLILYDLWSDEKAQQFDSFLIIPPARFMHPSIAFLRAKNCRIADHPSIASLCRELSYCWSVHKSRSGK